METGSTCILKTCQGRINPQVTIIKNKNDRIVVRLEEDYRDGAKGDIFHTSQVSISKVNFTP